MLSYDIWKLFFILFALLSRYFYFHSVTRTHKFDKKKSLWGSHHQYRSPFYFICRLFLFLFFAFCTYNNNLSDSRPCCRCYHWSQFNWNDKNRATKKKILSTSSQIYVCVFEKFKEFYNNQPSHIPENIDTNISHRIIVWHPEMRLHSNMELFNSICSIRIFIWLLNPCRSYKSANALSRFRIKAKRMSKQKERKSARKKKTTKRKQKIADQWANSRE